MKKTILIFEIIILLLCIANVLKAQTLTPNGTPIESFQNPEGSPANIAAWESQAAGWLRDRGYTNLVERVGAASATYNCHSFAWNISEGGTNVWINAYNFLDLYTFNEYDSNSNPPQPLNIKKYWNDSSYVEVSETNATKVWFGSCWQWNGTRWVDNCDHSANKLSSGLYESKWGHWPRYKHPADKCPYALNNRKYYKRNLPVISGPSTVCDQATYTIANLPSGATVQWSTSNSNLTLVSGQGTGTAVFRRNGNGNCEINASIIMGTDSISLASQRIWVGTPRIDGITGQQHFPYGGTGVYTAVVSGGESISYHWSVYPNRPISFNGNHAIIQFPSTNGDFQITLTVSNACGNTIEHHFVATGEYEPWKIYPNPATDIVTVQLDDEYRETSAASDQDAAKNRLPGTAEIQLWNASVLLRTYKTDQNTFQIPVSELPAGIYFVRVVKDGKTETKKLIVR